MSDLNHVPQIEEAIVVSSNTIHKSVEDFEAQRMFQKNRDNSVFHEMICFYDKPIKFHSFIILSKGEQVELNSGDSTIKLVSETSLISDSTELKVFVRTIEEGRSPEFKQIRLYNKTENSLVFTETERIELKGSHLVDRILVVGSFESLTYLVLTFKNYESKFPRWNLFKNKVYYGKNILDLSKHIISSDSLNDSFTQEKQDKPKLNLLKENKGTNYRTLNDLINYLVINEQYEKIQTLKKNFNYLVEDVKSEKHLEDTVILLSKFICNDLLFKEFLDYNTLESLTRIAFTNIEYEQENNVFKLLKLLIHDSRLARYFINQLGFGKELNNLFTDETNMDNKNSLLNLLIITLSHPYCISKFLSNELGEMEYSYDQFVYEVSALSLFPRVFHKWLQDIGSNIGVYVALSQTEALYNNINNDKMELGKNFTENLLVLSKSVNFSIDRINQMEPGKEDLTTNRNKFIRNFVVSSVRDTQFTRVLNSLFNMVLYQLSHFPFLCIDLYNIVDKPFKFIKKYMEYFQFQDTLVVLYKVSSLVLKLWEPIQGTLRKGFPYMFQPVHGYFNLLTKETLDLLLYSRVLSLLSSTISQGSFDTTIGEIISLSKEFENFYQVFNRFLKKTPILTFILKSLNSYVILIRDDSPQQLTNKINKNVSLLLNLICRSLERDQTFTLMWNFGRTIMEFLEFYLPKFGNNLTYLDSDLVNSTLSILKNVYNETKRKTDGDLKDEIEDIGEFLNKVFKTGGLDFESQELKDQSKTQVESVTKTRNDKKEKNMKTDGTYKMSSSYSNFLNFNLIDLREEHVATLERATELGVEPEKHKHYINLDLSVIPKKRLQPEIDYAVSLAINLAQRLENNHLFRVFLENEEGKQLSDLWKYCLSCISTNFKTRVQSEINSFSSLVGYAWQDNAKDYLPVLTKVMYLFYLSLRHLSNDTVNVDFLEILSSSMYSEYQEQLEELNSSYTNDDLIRCLVYSSTYLFSLKNRDLEEDLSHLNMMSTLMYYWFRRFKRSRGYILNNLMTYCSSMPMMNQGLSFLIASCKPFSDLRMAMSFQTVKKEKDKRDSKIKNREGLEIDKYKQDDGETFSFKDEVYKLSNEKVESGTNEEIITVLQNYEKLNKHVIAEFMCMVASRGSSMDPVTLLSNSCMAFFLIVNSLPVFEFIQLELEKEQDLNTKLRKVVFYKNILYFYNMDRSKHLESFFNINFKLLELINQIFNEKSLPIYSYYVLFEGSLNCFECHNKLWIRDHQHLKAMNNFKNYTSQLVSTVGHIINTLNQSKLDYTKEDSEDSLTSDLVLLGLYSIWTALQLPFTTLSVLYSLSESEDFVKVINYSSKTKKHQKSEKYESKSFGNNTSRSSNNEHDQRLSVQLCDFLNTNNILDYLREVSSESQKLSEGSLLNLIYTFHLFVNIFTSIHYTGRNQDLFIFHIALNTPFEKLQYLNTASELFDTMFFSLDTIMDKIKSEENKKNLIAMLVTIKINLQDLKKELLEHTDLKLPKSVPLSLLFNEPMSENNLYMFNKFGISLGKLLLFTSNSYRTWKNWKKLVSTSSMQVDYRQNESLLPFTRNCTFEYEKHYPEPDTDISKVKISFKKDQRDQPKLELNSDQWNQFDLELSSKGLDLFSLVKDPSLLRQTQIRRDFLNVVTKNETMFRHIVNLGLDILN